MGLTKSEIFTDKQNKLAGMMKALAHPARIAIIQYLIKANACVNGQLVDELGLDSLDLVRVVMQQEVSIDESGELEAVCRIDWRNRFIHER